GGAKLYDVTTNDTSSFLPSSYESVKGIKFGESHFGKIKGATTVTGLVRRTDQGPLTRADRTSVAVLVSRFPAWRADINDLKKHGAGGLQFKSSFSKRKANTRALAPKILGVSGSGRDELVSLQFKGNSADPTTMRAFKQFRSRTVQAF